MIIRTTSTIILTLGFLFLVHYSKIWSSIFPINLINDEYLRIIVCAFIFDKVCQMKSFLAVIFTIVLLCNSQQIPEYLAVVAQGRVRSQISSFTYTAMTELLRRYPTDPELVSGFKVPTIKISKQEMMQHIKDKSSQTGWIDADPWHITCLYIGENTTKLETPYYKNFTPNQPVYYNDCK